MTYTLDQRIAKGEPRAVARQKGEMMYLPNKPCSKNHLTLRYVKHGQCLDCLRELKKKARAEGRYKEVEDNYRKVYGKRQRERMRASVYGLIPEEIEKLKELQNFKCAICDDDFKEEKFTHVDHCHTSGEIRGILCRRCNVGMGNFKDDVAIMQKAINYIISHKEKNKNIINIIKPPGKRGWEARCNSCKTSIRIKLKKHEPIRSEEEIARHKFNFICSKCSW